MVSEPLSNPSETWLIYDPVETPASYRWETGNNDWNQMVTVSDAQGNIASFDRPLQFNYTHSTANDANGSNSHDGKRFLLQYGGEGELWGFPWEEDQDSRRWHPAVTLADGVSLSNAFVVKGIEKEQTMKDDSGGCALLNIDSLFNDPALVLPTVADIGAVSFNLSDKPEVTDPPAVIEGEVQ